MHISQYLSHLLSIVSLYKRSYGIPILLLACGLLLAACTSNPAPGATTPAAQPGSPSQPLPTIGTTRATPVVTPVNPSSPMPTPSVSSYTGPREKVTVGIGSAAGNIVYLQIDLAKGLGYFDEQGLDVDYRYFQGGSEAARALIAGNIDFSGNSIDDGIKLKMQGKDSKMVAAFTILPDVTLVVRSDLKDQIKSLKDLKGRKIGVTSIGSGAQVMAIYMVNKAGLARDDVEIVPVGATGTFVAAMKNKQIDAGIATDPTAAQLLSSGTAVSLIDLATEEGTKEMFGSADYQFTGLLTTPEVIAKRPQVVQRVVNAVVKAGRYIAEHPGEDIAQHMPADILKDKRSFAQGVDHSRQALSKDGIVTLEGVRNNYQSQIVFGSIKAGQNVDLASLFDMAFVNEALQH